MHDNNKMKKQYSSKWMNIKNYEKYKFIEAALYDKCARGDITLEEREDLINKAKQKCLAIDKKDGLDVLIDENYDNDFSFNTSHNSSNKTHKKSQSSSFNPRLLEKRIINSSLYKEAYSIEKEIQNMGSPSIYYESENKDNFKKIKAQNTRYLKEFRESLREKNVSDANSSKKDIKKLLNTFRSSVSQVSDIKEYAYLLNLYGHLLSYNTKYLLRIAPIRGRNLYHTGTIIKDISDNVKHINLTNKALIKLSKNNDVSKKDLKPLIKELDNSTKDLLRLMNSFVEDLNHELTSKDTTSTKVESTLSYLDNTLGSYNTLINNYDKYDYTKKVLYEKCANGEIDVDLREELLDKAYKKYREK